LKWTKELLKDKWFIVNSQEECDKVGNFLESFGIPKWDHSSYELQKNDIKNNYRDHIIIINCNKDYMITQYQLQKSGLKEEDKILFDDLFPKENLKSKLIELFSQPKTIFYLRSKEEASRLNKLLKELNYLDLDYDRIPDILTNWYQKDECDKLCMIDLYNFNDKNLDNLEVIQITFDNLLDYVK